MTTRTTLKLAVLAAGTLFTSIAVQASTANFDFKSGGTNVGSGFGNVRTFNSSGITVTATAWGLADANANFAAGQLGRASGIGLYDCNASEGLSCGSPQHQLDNVSGYDFVLFQFSQAVDPATVTIKSYSNADLDVSYYLGTTANGLSLAGVSLSGLQSLGFGNVIHDDSVANSAGRAVGIANTGLVNSILFGARMNGDRNADYFKISAASVETTPQVPEPATYITAGAALVGMAAVRRLRARA